MGASGKFLYLYLYLRPGMWERPQLGQQLVAVLICFYCERPCAWPYVVMLFLFARVGRVVNVIEKLGCFIYFCLADCLVCKRRKFFDKLGHGGLGDDLIRHLTSGG